MKQYVVRIGESTYNLAVCDILQNSMARECFLLERVRPFGTFVFEYNESAKKYAYFSCIFSGVLNRKKLRGIIAELRLVYQLQEAVRINTSLTVYRFERETIKGRDYLDELAKSHGLEKFSHDGFLDALRKERDAIIASDYKNLAIILGICAILFGAGTLTLWFSAIPCAIAAVLCVMNLVRFLRVKAYISCSQPEKSDCNKI